MFRHTFLICSIVAGLSAYEPAVETINEQEAQIANEQVQISIEESLVDYNQDRTGKPIILDLDFCTDVDDACGIRVAGTLHKRGIIDLKAITLNTNSETDSNLYAASGLINYIGVTGIPIGRSSVYELDTSPYWEVCSQYSESDIHIEDSVKLWREILAESEEPVDIITTGYLTNLWVVCTSQADEISDKNGLELIKEKAGNIYIVGGSYPNGWDNNFSFTYDARQAAGYCFENLDNLIVITNRVANEILCGGEIQRVDTERQDPLTQALFAFGTSNGRAAWDPFGVLVGAYVNNEDQLHSLGLELMRVDINFDVASANIEFTPSDTGKHLRLYRTNTDLEYYAKILDELTFGTELNIIE